MNPRKLTLLLVTALVALPLAGCLSGAEEEDPATSNVAKNETTDAPVDTGSPTDDARPRGNGDPGSVAHKHDYWAGRTEVVLVDAEFQPDFCLNGYDDQFSYGCFVVTMGNGTIVYQGTAKMTLLATWSDPKVTGLRMVYADAEKTHTQKPVQLQSGVPLEIPVTQASADMPHTKASEWWFEFLAGGTGPVGTLAAPVHLTITITRGLDLPLDPPHPDFWRDTDMLDLGNVSGTLKKPEPQFLVFGAKRDAIHLPEGKIVPPGTNTVMVHFTYKIKDPQEGVVYSVNPVYTSAENSWWRWVPDAYTVGNEGEGMFEIEVEPSMTDSPYSTVSQWKFSFRQYQAAGSPAGPIINLPTSWGFLGTNPFDRDIEYTFHVMAHGAGHDMEAMDM